ncbi:hypothetical protein [Blastococcus sp. SYSU D00813]
MSPTLIAPAAPEPAAPRLRRLRTAAVLAGAGLRPGTSRRAAVCGAARLLTALGVRVRVQAPLVAWPRVRPGSPGVLVVADSRSDLAHLALTTAVPGTVAVEGRPGRHARALRLPVLPASADAIAAALRAGTTVTVRPGADGRLSPAGFAAAAATGAPVCPVAVRSRPGAGVTVVELHLLPEVAGATGDPAALADGARRALTALPGGLAAGARPEPARGGGQRGPATR